jgi:hypothetical protein
VPPVADASSPRVPTAACRPRMDQESRRARRATTTKSAVATERTSRCTHAITTSWSLEMARLSCLPGAGPGRHLVRRRRVRSAGRRHRRRHRGRSEAGGHVGHGFARHERIDHDHAGDDCRGHFHHDSRHIINHRRHHRASGNSSRSGSDDGRCRHRCNRSPDGPDRRRRHHRHVRREHRPPDRHRHPRARPLWLRRGISGARSTHRWTGRHLGCRRPRQRRQIRSPPPLRRGARCRCRPEDDRERPRDRPVRRTRWLRGPPPPGRICSGRRPVALDQRLRRDRCAPVTPSTNGPANDPAPAAVYYKNCTAVRAAGAAPIRAGDPGWQSKFDGDGDGVGCE